MTTAGESQAEVLIERLKLVLDQLQVDVAVLVLRADRAEARIQRVLQYLADRAHTFQPLEAAGIVALLNEENDR